MDKSNGQSLHSLLTARELEILRRVLAGMSNRDIAEELFLAPETVRWYTKQIYSKLGVHSRIEAITQARESGWFDDSAPIPITPQNSPPKNNLPGQLTPLIGREEALTSVKRLIRQSRLVTLTGPGGIGKTRLALQLAVEVQDDFADGVYFVPLASVSDPTLVANAVALALVVSEVRGESLADTLAKTLRPQQLLLVMDNFEHLIPAAPLVSDLLAAAPGLKVIATSREALRLYGEHEYPVPPLNVPDLQQRQTPADLAQNEAAALFVQRAAAVNPTFAITEDTAPAIAEICVRLEGLPLALELAAARVKIFTPQTLLERLAKHDLLTTLTGGARNVHARQQTLRATIDWSYGLLDEDEKRLFARLAVFSGGCTLEAAEAVCGEDGGDVGAQRAAPLPDGLESLVNKSLIRRVESQEGQPRFTMLETIHEYALEKLASSGHEDDTRRHHADYLIALAEESEPYFYGKRMNWPWFNRLEAERGNFRAALGWLLSADGKAEKETALHLAAALGDYWFAGDYQSEELKWLETTLELAPNAPPAVRARALRWAGELSAFLLYRERSVAWLEEALTLAQQAGDMRLTAWALGGLGLQAMIQGDFDRADALHEQALSLFRAAGDEMGMSDSLRSLAMIAADHREFERATVFMDEALPLARAHHDKAAEGWVFYISGYAAWFGKNNRQEAIDLTQASLSLFQEDGNRLAIGFALIRLGETARLQGNYAQAKTAYQDALTSAQKINYKLSVAQCLDGLGAVARIDGQYRRAARLLGAAHILYAAIGPTIDLASLGGIDDELAAARAELGETAFAAAWAEGQAMTPEQAISYALRLSDDRA